MMEQKNEECHEDEGRQVQPHRSGGGQLVHVVGDGHLRMAVAAALACAGIQTVQAGMHREIDWFGDRKEPTNTGRRSEKDAARLAKAEAKRQRKAEKRAKNGRMT
jgi:hypothetical protein